MYVGLMLLLQVFNVLNMICGQLQWAFDQCVCNFLLVKIVQSPFNPIMGRGKYILTITPSDLLLSY